MQKPLVFISHITSEKEIAMALKSLVSDAFIGMIEVFVSSDPESNSMGGKWLQKITDGLKTCVIEIILVSPASIKRPWINFEAGAGWVRDIPVIPLCHSGMTPDHLPSPLGSLQGGSATDSKQLQNVFNVMSKTLGCNRCDIDFTQFIKAVESYQETSHKLEVAGNKTLTADVSGLSDVEVATLIALAECTDSPGDFVWPSCARSRMNKAGYKDIAASIGVAGLQRKGMLDKHERDTADYMDEKRIVVCLNSNGWTWLSENEERIEMKAPPRTINDTEMPF